MSDDLESRLCHLLAAAGIEYRRGGEDSHVRHGWLGIRCPLCASSGFHMGISLRTLGGHCWKCGGHSLNAIARALGNISARDIRAIRGDLEGDTGRAVAVSPVIRRYTPPADIGPLTAAHERYLRGRKIDVDADWFAKYQIQSVGMGGGEYKYRIFLPVIIGRKAVSFTTRSTLDRGLRYRSAEAEMESVPHKHLLFGEDLVGSTVVAHEGPLDALRVGPGAVCTFGTAYSRQQVCRLARFPNRYICFDSEPAAQVRAEKLADDLSTLPGQTWVIALDSDDAGSATDKEIRRLRRLISR